MPKLRVVKKPEDSAKIPDTEGVQVELPPTVDVADVKAATDDVDPFAPPEKTPRVEGPKKTEERDPDDSIEALKAQRDDLKKAHENALAHAADADRKRQEAQNQVQERDQQITEIRGTAQQAEYESIVNALVAAQAEAESAERDLENAATNADYKALAAAQRKLSRAESRAVQLEDAKAGFEARQERLKTEKRDPPPMTGDPVENHIDSLPGLMGTERQWLKAHRDVVSDARKNARLQAAYYDAQDEGLSRGTEAYFAFIEEKLGYRKPMKPQETEDDESVGVAAPVSREAPSAGTGRPSNNRITLTPEQRVHAKASGVDDITYAKGLLVMEQRKKDGYQ